jgi:hypothetical protein
VIAVETREKKILSTTAVESVEIFDHSFFEFQAVHAVKTGIWIEISKASTFVGLAH